MAKAVSMEPVPTTTWWIYLLEGIGAVLIGLLLLMAPAATIVAITLFLGFYWLFVGVLELVRMFVDRSVPWYWSLLIGLLGIAAGLLVLNHPLFAAVILPATLVIYLGVLGIVIGIFAIIGGFSGGGIGSFIFGVLNLLDRFAAPELAGRGNARRAVRVRPPSLDRGHRADRLGLPRPRLGERCGQAGQTLTRRLLLRGLRRRRCDRRHFPVAVGGAALPAVDVVLHLGGKPGRHSAVLGGDRRRGALPLEVDDIGRKARAPEICALMHGDGAPCRRQG